MYLFLLLLQIVAQSAIREYEWGLHHKARLIDLERKHQLELNNLSVVILFLKTLWTEIAMVLFAVYEDHMNKTNLQVFSNKHVIFFTRIQSYTKFYKDTIIVSWFA